MPKEKTLLFIGAWIIILSNFIGISTEIKNYLFIATGIILIAISYSTGFSKNESEENFFHVQKKNIENKFKKTPEIKPTREPIISSIKKEKFVETSPEEAKTDLSNPFKDMDRESYEPVIKVRKSRSKPKPKLVREEKIIEETENLVTNNFPEEDDDVIVISSDGDSENIS